MNTNNLLQEIVKKWSWKVPDGKPNPKNPLHLVHLREVLEEKKFSLNEIDMLMSTFDGKQLGKVYTDKDLKPFENPNKEKEMFVEFGMQLINLGELLSEASIFQGKYPNGSRFLLSKSGKEGVAKYSSEKLSDGVFEKTTKTDDAIDIIHSEGGEEFWVKSENGKVYHIQGKGSVIGKWFLRASKNPSDISFNTPTLEACSILGMKVDGKSWLSKFNSATEETIPSLVSEFEKECNSAMG